MDDLDCLVEILCRCDLSDLASAACVSKSWHAAAVQVLTDAGIDMNVVGSHRMDSCTVMLARSIPCLDTSSQGWDHGSYVDVHESHGRVAFIDDCGCVKVFKRNGCSLTHVARIPHQGDERDSEWKVFVLGGTRNILSIRPNYCCNVYVEGADSGYRLKHRFWPSSLASRQDDLKFCMEESDPQYIYVGCSAGKVLQLDVFNQGAVSSVYRSSADGNVTAMVASTIGEKPILLVATTDDSHIPCITVYDAGESSTIRCPSNTRYKTLRHLDVPHGCQCVRVLGTCENMLLLWNIVRDNQKVRLVYVTHTRTSPQIPGHSFLPNLCGDHGNLYACGLVESQSVCVYSITNDSIQQIHHVPVFGSNPMEQAKMSVDSLRKILWYASHPALFISESSAGILLLPKKSHRFSRPSSFLHLSFL